MKIKSPIRAQRTYVQKLSAPPERVFPLVCPVREAEWIEGWDPIVVYSRSGVAEPDCVFITREGERETTWAITDHGRVEMVRMTPGSTVCKLRIDLSANDAAAVSRQYESASIVESERKRGGFERRSPSVRAARA